MEEQSVRCVIVEKVISRPDFRELRVCQAGQGLLNIPIVRFFRRDLNTAKYMTRPIFLDQLSSCNT
jgi:hypothetical protein